MPVLELHVWGPAFSLPSLDAQCLATIAFLSQTVPKGSWKLIASSDPSLSPTHELPALRSGDTWISGFRNIVDYAANCSDGAWSLDNGLEGVKKADCIAFSSFIEAYGQPLLDLSLYVSTRNYTAVTRPLYSTIQPFSLQYITQSSIRSAAKARTAHLGLSSLDIDSGSENPEDQYQSIIPQSLRTTKTTVSSLLSQSPEQAAQIRLEALAVSFFEPLQALRGGKQFFISQYPTSLDCLALGYLALALLPDLPSPWLANCMRRKFPHLCAFVNDMQLSFYGGAVKLEDAYLSPSLALEQGQGERPSARNGALPWSPPGHLSVRARAGALFSTIVESIPVVSNLRQTKRIRNEPDPDTDKGKDQGATEVLKREHLISSASIILGISAFVGLTLWYSVLGRKGLPPRVFIPYDSSRSHHLSTDERTQERTALNVLDDLDIAFTQ